MPPDMNAPAVEYEMGYQAAEFGKVLTGPFTSETSPYRFENIGPGQWRISQPNDVFLLQIKITVKPNRKLGLLIEVPVLQVQFYLEQGGEVEQQAFFKRFHQYFHKGGG